MGSKRFQGKQCAYCEVEQAITGDHVFCREFFPVENREGLPKAPACKKCNNAKSALEHYLTTVLPFGSNHPAALTGQLGKVKRRLSKAPRTRDQLRRDATVVWVKTTAGILVPTLGLPLDGQKFTQYMRLGIRGLVWCEWSAVVPPNYVVEVFALDPEAFEVFSETVLQLGASTKVRRSFANGALKYRAARAKGDAAFSTWHLCLYENLGLSLWPSADGHERLEVVGITGPPEIKAIVDNVLSEADA